MPKVTISPDDVIDYKTPLYKENKELGKVLRLLPETTSDQVNYANGQNGEAVKTALETSIAAVQSTAEAAQSTANTAKGTAEGVQAQVDNATTGLAATKAIADDALESANAALNKHGDTMEGKLSFFVDNFIKIYDQRYDLTENPSSNLYQSIVVFGDKNDKMWARWMNRHSQTGLVQYFLEIYKTVSGSTQRVGFWCYEVNANNEAQLVIPTLPVTPNVNSATTVAWVNNKLGTGASTAALAALDESDPNYVETLETKKLKAVAQVNAEVQQAIYGGFPYEINGEEYHIGYTLFDQQNLQARAIVALQSPNSSIQMPCIDETGHNVWLDVSPETVLAIHKFGLISFVDVIRKAADYKKSQIIGAETEAEIQEILAE